MRRTLADSGRFPMAWLSRPCFRGDLFLCTDVLPQWYFRPVYETEYEPAMRCIGPLRGRNAVCRCSLPCVGAVDEGIRRLRLWPERDRYRLLKPRLQKRLKKRTDCGGNHLGCRKSRKGITVRTKWQSGRADGNAAKQRRKGNRLHRQREVRCRETQPVPKP